MVGSPALRYGFIALTLTLALAFLAAVYTSAVRMGRPTGFAARQTTVAAICSAVWLGGSVLAAARGILQFKAPPTMLILMAITLVLACGLATSALGKQIARGIPLSLLVGFQAFRIVVELLLHRAYSEGLMPVQMSYSGHNYDIVSGITALGLGLWLALGRPSMLVVKAWNILGAILLLNILGIALLSAPTPVRVFMNEPANVWITNAPWVWLPTAMVFAAIFGHIALLRRLKDENV